MFILRSVSSYCPQRTNYLILSIQFLTNYLLYVVICASPLPPSAGDNVGGGILKFAS